MTRRTQQMGEFLREEVVDIIQELGSPAARTVAVAVTTVLAPLTEELLFRGILLKSMRGRRRIMVVTATVFSLFHLIGVTSWPAGILVFVQIFLVGASRADHLLGQDVDVSDRGGSQRSDRFTCPSAV